MRFSASIIKLLRNSYGISLSEISILCDMSSKGTVANYEIGNSTPSTKAYEALANVFGVSGFVIGYSTFAAHIAKNRNLRK